MIKLILLLLFVIAGIRFVVLSQLYVASVIPLNHLDLVASGLFILTFLYFVNSNKKK